MTVAHGAEPLIAEDAELAAAAVRERGLRVTAGRRLMIEALFATDRPLSAEQIASGLDGRFPSSDVASVYRNLERLESIGLVRHVHLGHGPGLYTLAGRRRGAFVVCDRCGRHEALSDPDLEAISGAVGDRLGYRARFDHFPIVGLCPDCSRDGAD